jgi:hypothetical protein
MTWKDILKQDELQKAPFGMFRRNKNPAESKPSLVEQDRIRNVKNHMGEIVSAYKNDPDFQSMGQFNIKVVPESFEGRGRMGSGDKKLTWEMQEDLFGDANFVQQHGIPVLEQFGFNVEKAGDLIVVKKGDPNV